MKRPILFLLSVAAVLGASAAFVERTDDFDPVTVLATGSLSGRTLNLTNCWDMTALDAQTIPYSSVGWEPEPEVNAYTVTLSYAPEAGGDAVTLASGLTGRSTHAWQPSDLSKTVYLLTHAVYSGSSSLADRKLTARYSFVNCRMPASEAEILLAVMSAGHDCTFSNDATNPWQPIAGEGQGIRSEAASAARLSFSFSGKGTFYLDYQLTGGAFSITLDGVPQGPFAAASAWTGVTFDVTHAGTHAVVVDFTPAGGSTASLKGCHWQERASLSWQAESAEVRADLRGGVVRRAWKPVEYMPAAYSITNFTGVAGATSESKAHIRVVQVVPEGDDPAGWTNELAATARDIRLPGDEGTVNWRGHRGFWKADYWITTGDVTNHAERAFIDMTRYIRGFVFYVCGQ